VAERLIIVETFAPEYDDATGRTVGEVAAVRRMLETARRDDGRRYYPSNLAIA
jgi:hypothetical protein